LSSFSSAELGPNAKAWVIRQAPDGVLYFGGNLDLTSFDGDRWRSYPAGNGYAIRGLDFSADGKRLWAGEINELGWFDQADDGSWKFHSLAGSIPEGLRNFGDCWFAFAIDNGAVFVTRDRVFRWDGKAMRTWSFPNKSRLSAMRFGNAIFLDDGTSGLYRFDQDDFRLEIGASKLGRSRVFWIGPLGLDWLLVTSGGLETWDGVSVHSFSPGASAYIRAKTLTSAVSVPGGRVAIGTLTGGIAILAPDGDLEQVLNKESAGLPTDEIYSLATDRSGNLWATSSAHIFHVNLASGAVFFDRSASPSTDPFIAVASNQDRVFAATPTEIYSLRTSPAELLSAPMIPSPVSNIAGLVPFGKGVLAGHRWGIDYVGDGSPRRIWTSRQDVLAITVSKKPGHIFASDAGEIVDIDTATLASRVVVPSLSDNPVALAEDAEGRLWVGTTTEGISIVPNPDSAKPTIEAATRLFPELPDTGLGDLRRTPSGALFVFVGTRGWFLPPGGQALVAISGWPNRSVDSTAVDGVSLADRDGTIWIVHPPADGHPAVVASITPDGEGAAWHAHTVDGLWKIGVPASIYAQQTPRGDTLYITGSGGILRVDASPKDLPVPPPEPIVHVLAQGGDDPQFQAIEGPLPYSTRKVLIRVAVPTFERRPAMEPQVLVDGIDTSWTGFDAKSERELTGLRDGTYSVHVRVLADTGLTSDPVSVTLVIKPPWWRTPPFEILFALGAVGLFYGSHLFRVRNLRHRAAELEVTVKRRTEQADRANAAKSEFIARVSHNIRNPLNGIVGLTVALNDTVLGERQRELLEALDACAQQLTSLIDDVLDFSRIEAGKVDLKPSACSLQGVLESIATSIAARAAATDSMIEVQVDPALPPYVMVDAHRLEEILLNYMTNAIRYAPGRILLAAGLSPQSPNVLECSVQDHGPGFSEEEKDSLFVNFTRLSDNSTMSSSGTGLGLALCRRLADLMGGSVGVEGAKGAGARFFVRLPLIATEAPKPEVRSIFSIARALIVEDADYNTWAFTAVLSHLGITVCDRARDGSEALGLFQDRHYDLILLDRHLPDIDGISVAQKMRQMEENRAHTLIVCVSAYSTTEDRDRCLAAGMDYFAGKPLTPEKLSQILREAGVGFRPAPSLQLSRPEGAKKTVNLSMLEYLAKGTDGSLARQIERYVTTLRTAVEELQEAVASDDMAGTKVKAHALLGMARYVDSQALADLANAVTAAAQRRDSAELARLTQQIRDTSNRLAGELNGGGSGTL
jgi:signal transduction histidine kinase/CheY-like chemotaxis protein